MSLRQQPSQRLLKLRQLTLLLLLLFSPLLHAKTLLVLGDSLSAGYGMDLENGWVQLLSDKLNSHFSATVTGDSDHLSKGKTPGNTKYRIVNASISGETTAGGLARLPALLREHNPDIVIVELGGNDGLRGYPVKLIRNNLAAIAKLSREADARVLLLGIQIPPNYGQRYTRQFAGLYKELASEKQIPLVPFFLENVAVNAELMQEDGLHPNARAQRQLLNNVLPHLQPLLKVTALPHNPPSAAGSSSP